MRQLRRLHTQDMYICTKVSDTFLFGTTGAKRKVIKRETPGDLSPSADGDEGCAPSTGAAF